MLADDDVSLAGSLRLFAQVVILAVDEGDEVCVLLYLAGVMSDDAAVRDPVGGAGDG